MCQNLYHRIHNIHIKFAEISCERSTLRKCNKGIGDNIGREHFEQHTPMTASHQKNKKNSTCKKPWLHPQQ
jgi:hypothetical protein